MKFLVFNLKKDFNIILKNSILLIIVLYLSLQIYGIYWNSYKYKKDQIFQNIGISIEIDDLDENKYKKLKAITGIKNIDISYSAEQNNIFIKNIDFNEVQKEIEEFSIHFISINTEYYIDNIYEGENVDLLDNRNKIVVPNLIYEFYKLKLGDKIIINDIEFEIVGVNGLEFSQSFIISIDSANKLNLNKAKLNLLLNSGLNDFEIDEILNKISNTVGKEVMYPNLVQYTNDGNFEIFQFLLIILILSIFNIVLIYNYFLQKREKRRAIYRIEGLSFRKMTLLLIIELIIIFIISVIISTSLIIVFNKIIMENIFNINRFSLPIKNYLLLYLVYFIVYMAFIMINNIKLYKKNLLLK